MGKTSDILRELEDIGAVGSKIQAPVVRRAVPVVALPVFETQPALMPKTNEVLTGFAAQLEILEAALQGMLEWCAAARASVLEAEGPEEERGESFDAEGEDERETEESSEEPVEPAPPPEPVVAKPKLSLAEIRKHFLDPKFQPEEPPINGASHTETVAVPTIETEKTS